MFREYLVNFKYFVRLMEDYGFILVKKEEAIQMQLPDSTGLFNELFQNMENEITANKQSRNYYGESKNMSSEEKRISFMNRYFVFKKVRNENVEKMAKILEKDAKNAEEKQEEMLADATASAATAAAASVESTQIQSPIQVQKIKRKLVLNKYKTPTAEQPPVSIQEPTVVTELPPTSGTIKLKIKRPPATKI